MKKGEPIKVASTRYPKDVVQFSPAFGGRSSSFVSFLSDIGGQYSGSDVSDQFDRDWAAAAEDVARRLFYLFIV